MATTLTSKGQVTIPKPIREALRLTRASAVEFCVNDAGQVVVRAASPVSTTKAVRDRFAAVRGKAQVKWRTDELMHLLRSWGSASQRRLFWLTPMC